MKTLLIPIATLAVAAAAYALTPSGNCHTAVNPSSIPADPACPACASETLNNYGCTGGSNMYQCQSGAEDDIYLKNYKATTVNGQCVCQYTGAASDTKVVLNFYNNNGPLCSVQPVCDTGS